MIRRAFLVIAALLIAGAVSASDLVAVLERSESVNETWFTVTSDSELAGLRNERTLVESGSERQTLAAELAFAAARAAERRGRIAFYSEVVDASYGLELSRLDREASGLALGRAEAARDDAVARAGNGLASEREVIQARIGVSSAELEVERADWRLGDARDDFVIVTGLDRESVDLPGEPRLDMRLSEADWVERDLDLARERLGVTIAELELGRLAASASRFDRRTAEIELERARAALVRARRNALLGYESFVRRASVQEQTIRIAEEQLSFREALAEEARIRYERDFISASERDQTRINVISARVVLLEAQRDYVKTILEYAAVAGLAADEVL